MAESRTSKKAHRFTTTVMVYGGNAHTKAQKGAWYFAPLPIALSTTLKNTHKAIAGGWGSLRVTVRIGATKWDTSIFPDTKSGVYLLPLKAEIRRKETIGDGDTLSILLTVVQDYERNSTRST